MKTLRITTAFGLGLALAFVVATTAQAASYTATQNGNWSATATWGGSGPPGGSDTATIPMGITVTYNANTTVGTLNNNGVCTNLGPFYLTATTLNQGNDAVFFEGTSGWTLTTLSATANGNTVGYVYNGATPKATTYYNLYIATGGGNTTLASIPAINGDLIVGPGAIINTGPSSAWSLGGLVWNTTQNPVTFLTVGTTMTRNMYVGGFVGASAVSISGVIGDSGSAYSLTKFGGSTINLNPTAVETYTGSTIINGGILVEDYSAGSINNNLISSSSPLAFGYNYLGAGTNKVSGRSGATISQTFNGLILSNGAACVTNVLVGTKTTTALGAITRNDFGGTVDFGGNGTAGASGTTPITTTTANYNGILGGYATFGRVNWAANDGSGGIIAYTGYNNSPPTSGDNPTVNYSGNGTTLAGSFTANSWKLTGGTLACANYVCTLSNGLLVSATATITTNTTGYVTAGAGKDLIVNVVQGVTLTARGTPIGGNSSAGVTKTGGGTWDIATSGQAGPNFTGPLYVRQGAISWTFPGFQEVLKSCI